MWGAEVAGTRYRAAEVSGTALLGARLKARVDVIGLAAKAIDDNSALATQLRIDRRRWRHGDD